MESKKPDDFSSPKLWTRVHSLAPSQRLSSSSRYALFAENGSRYPTAHGEIEEASLFVPMIMQMIITVASGNFHAKWLDVVQEFTKA